MEDPIKPTPSKTVPLLLGFIALLLLIIAVLLYVIFTKLPITSDTGTKITPSASPSVSLSTSPSVPPSDEWKELTQTVESYYSDSDITISGLFPNDTVITTDGLDAAGANFSNQSYSLSVLFVADNDVIHYNSYEPLQKHSQFGEINRIKSSDNNMARSFYSNSVVTKTGGCMYLENLIESPCGIDTVTIGISPDPAKGIQGNDLMISIRCQASEENTIAICDRIVNSLKIK